MGRVRKHSGEQMMLDLASHLRAISTPPECPDGWHVQTALATADGAPIGGDFIVFAAQPDGSRLQAVLVDTSGKGADAATRSVMLAGAIGGLLGEVPSAQLLPAVNRHITGLGWEEHFATAVHLDIDLRSGEMRIGVAGHPPAVQFLAGSGRWATYRATGPALGFIPDASWTQHSARLAPGDALVIVTDGVIETPGQDLDVSLDRLIGHAERLVLDGFASGAHQLLAQRQHQGRDDAQVLLVTRSGASVPDPSRRMRGRRTQRRIPSQATPADAVSS